MAADPQVLNNELNELQVREIRIEDERGFGLVIQPVKEHAAERGLTRADLSGDDQDAFALLDAENQMRKGFSVMNAGEEKFRVGRDIEGVFSKTVKFVIHLC